MAQQVSFAFDSVAESVQDVHTPYVDDIALELSSQLNRQHIVSLEIFDEVYMRKSCWE